jgi:hypothetical protein
VIAVPVIEVRDDIDREKIVVSTWEQTRERRCDGPDVDSERTNEALRPEYDHVLAECPGTYGHTALPGVSIDPELREWLGLVPLPPGAFPAATLQPSERRRPSGRIPGPEAGQRTPPKCTAARKANVRVPETHDTGRGRSDGCGYRHGVGLEHRCRNCPIDSADEFSPSNPDPVPFRH